MTFDIKAEKRGLWYISIYQSGQLSLRGVMTDPEWTAFKALLMPCAKADFTLTETEGGLCFTKS